MYNNYNVAGLVSTFHSNTRSFLARVLNNLVADMNDKQYNYHLPRYVLIVLDKDLVQNIGTYDFGVSRIIEDMVKWLLININLVIEVRKEDVIKKRARALSSSLEPHLIWVQMVKRPVIQGNPTYALVRKFNTILEETIAGDRRSYILKPFITPNSTTLIS